MYILQNRYEKKRKRKEREKKRKGEENLIFPKKRERERTEIQKSKFTLNSKVPGMIRELALEVQPNMKRKFKNSKIFEILKCTFCNTFIYIKYL